MSRVLIIATSRKTRGGITAVIKAHETGEQWKKYHCHWVQTHRDGSALCKLFYLVRGFVDFLFRVPFYDIVHIHISQPTTIRRKRPFLKIAKMLGKKVIVHFHAFNVEDTIAGIFADNYAKFLHDADLILVLSNWWKEQLVSSLSIPLDKIRILYNPCPKVNLRIDRRTDSILYAGTVNERKGYQDLIKAFAMIADKHLSWSLNIAGNGEIDQGKNLVKVLKIENQVNFLGWINGESKETAFHKAAIFCLPSYAEGFPMAVLDAWAYALPVITTPVGGIPDIAIDGKNMLIFNPGDIKSLSLKLEQLIDDHDLRDKISVASIDFATKEFNQETINHKLETIYDNLLNYND